jgi:hypothetical protein
MRPWFLKQRITFKHSQQRSSWTMEAATDSSFVSVIGGLGHNEAIILEVRCSFFTDYFEMGVHFVTESRL